MRRLIPEEEDLRQRAADYEPSIARGLAAHRWSHVLTDDFGFVPDAWLRNAGYVRRRIFPLRVGRHDIRVVLWTLPPEPCTNKKT